MDGSSPPLRPNNISPLKFRATEPDSRDLVDQRVTQWSSSSEPEPPLRVLSSKRASREGFLRLEIEIALPLVELLARAASYLYPLIAEIEQQRAKDAGRAKRKERSRDRAKRMRIAGVQAFHRSRKSNDLSGRNRVILSVGQALGLSTHAVEIARKRYSREFRAKLRNRRESTARRLRNEARTDAEIAEYLGVSRGTVRRYLAKSH